MQNWIRRQRETVREWPLKSGIGSKAHRIGSRVLKVFTAHPHATGETYLQHLCFALKMSSRLAYAWSSLLLHGFLPFLCTRTASTQIKEAYRIVKDRAQQSRPLNLHNGSAETCVHYLQGVPSVAIVGGGFSGALALANIIRQAEGRLTIHWFDSGGSQGLGVAYGTTDPSHLLNVRAGAMGAYAGQPKDFWQWLQSEDGRAQAGLMRPERPVTAEDFVPRALYAHYLRHVVTLSLFKAKEKNISVHIHAAAVVDATLSGTLSRQVILHSEQNGMRQPMAADAVVLATGNLPPRRFPFQADIPPGDPRYLEDVWNPPAGHFFPERVDTLPPDSVIAVIGTGLTTVDTVLTLKARGFKGTIMAISRNGLLPAAHADIKPYPEWEWTRKPQSAPRTALPLLTRLRAEIRKAQKQGYDWRGVVDSLRPVTQPLWQQLSVNEKRKFLKRLLTFWNVHRHRMSPEAGAELNAMRQSGALGIVAGGILKATPAKDGLSVGYRKRGAAQTETIEAALLINCTGPEYDIGATRHPLLANMRARKLITPSPLKAGIEITKYGSAMGSAQEAIFPMGPLLIGALLECTAVPELREQAHEIAKKTLEHLSWLQNQVYDL